MGLLDVGRDSTVKVPFICKSKSCPPDTECPSTYVTSNVELPSRNASQLNSRWSESLWNNQLRPLLDRKRSCMRDLHSLLWGASH